MCQWCDLQDTFLTFNTLFTNLRAQVRSLSQVDTSAYPISGVIQKDYLKLGHPSRPAFLSSIPRT